MRTIAPIHARILELYAAKIGAPAAELEFQVFLNRIYMSGAGAVTLLAGFLAKAAQSWVLGGTSIAAFAVMTALLVRHFVLRHRFNRAVSSKLEYAVNWRHPVRGVPNWRRPISAERMQQLNEQFETWCHDREIALAPSNPEPGAHS